MSGGGQDGATIAIVASWRQKQEKRATVLAQVSSGGVGGVAGCVLVVLPMEEGGVAGGSRVLEWCGKLAEGRQGCCPCCSWEERRE